MNHGKDNHEKAVKIIQRYLPYRPRSEDPLADYSEYLWMMNFICDHTKMAEEVEVLRAEIDIYATAMGRVTARIKPV